MISEFKTLYDLIVGIGSQIQKLSDKRKSTITFDHVTIWGSLGDGKVEEEPPPCNPFGPKCSCYFQFSASDPVIDLTMINHHTTPVLLTRLGVQIVSLAHFWWLPSFVAEYNAWRNPAGAGLPEIRRLPVEDRVVLTVPDSWQEFKDERTLEFAANPSDLSRIEVKSIEENLWSELRDPLWMDVNAPVRFLIHLSGYHDRMPSHSMIRLRSRSNAGDSSSKPILICTSGSRVDAFIESLRRVREAYAHNKGSEVTSKIVEAASRFYESDKKAVADFVNFLGLRCYSKEFYEESSWFFNTFLELRKEYLPQHHPDLALSLNNLASSYRELGIYDKSEELYARSIALLETAQDRRRLLAFVLRAYAKLLKRTNRHAEADEVLRRADSLRSDEQ